MKQSGSETDFPFEMLESEIKMKELRGGSEKKGVKEGRGGRLGLFSIQKTETFCYEEGLLEKEREDYIEETNID